MATVGGRNRRPPRSRRAESASVPPAEAIKAFVAFAPMAVAMTDRDIRFLAVSPMWLDDFDVEEADLIGRTSYEMIPDTHARYAQLHQRSLAGEIVRSDPERVALPNGSHRWMMWEASPWRDDDGEVGGLLIISRDVTPQKDAEEEARRSRAFAYTILQNTPTPLVVKDEAGHVLMMNRAMEDLYGSTEADHLGKTVFDLLPHQAALAVTAEDQAALRSEVPTVIEQARMNTRHRGVRVVRKTKVAIRDGDGPAYLLAISEDITERLKIQEELERTRAFLTTLIESVPVPLTVKDTVEHRCVITNRANEEMLGVPRDAFLGKTVDELFPPEQAEAMRRFDEEVLESGQVHVAEVQALTTPGNGVREVRVIKTPIRTADGGTYILSIVQDITEQRLAAVELERTRAFLATVIDNIPAGLTVKEADTGRLLMSNPAAAEIFGVGMGGLGLTSHEIFSAEQAARFDRQDREVISSGEMRIFEDDRIWTPDGERFLRRKKSVIRNAEGPDYLLSISEDVTERKLAQDALKEALARAEAANVAKSEFLANMSHEIRTPLNGVLGLADALSRMQLTERQAEIVGMIVSSGKALTGILSDVLDLAKAEAGQLELQLEPFSLRETIGAAAFLFETVARGKGLDFDVDLECEGPDRLIGDPLRIRQVVSNLISNAVKFTSIGKVSVQVRCHRARDGAADLQVIVRDTGPGFSEEVRSRLFSRFEQGDGSITRRYGGTGLGLSIAGALADMMSGDITCSATPGEGATFVLNARMQVAEAGSEPAAAAVGPAVHADRPLRVLLAEDHAVNQEVVRLMLDGVAELVVTGDGQEAVSAFFDQAPFDVVLMDTQMPVMDGLTATRTIREGEARLQLGRTPIISLTANAMSHQVQACLEAGADLHLAKPITSEGLYDAINRAVEGPQAEQVALSA